VKDSTLPKPLLGLATTEQLLAELRARMMYETAEASIRLEQACMIAQHKLPQRVLNYRTVDSD
jgi:hypothetical protein